VIFAILLDTTDALSPVQQLMTLKNLEGLAAGASGYGKVEVFVVRSSSDTLIRPLLQVCNSGRASDVNEWTGNPRLLEKRWHEKFMDPLVQTLTRALADSVNSQQSPIMEEIQQVSVEAFFETPPTTSKRLAVVSDMLQNSQVLNQYSDPESFRDFQGQAGFEKVRPKLDNVGVTVLYVRRSSQTRV
jgi:hypothetical protein